MLVEFTMHLNQGPKWKVFGKEDKTKLPIRKCDGIWNR